MMRTIEKRIWALLCINAALFLQTASAQAPSPSATLPMTSQSDEARQLVQQALTLYLDRVQQEPANEILRKADQDRSLTSPWRTNFWRRSV
jgi:hypothetical protein